MNESMLSKFCESTHRKLIVVIVTTVIGLLVLVPLVDEYFDARESYKVLAADLDDARKTSQTLPDLEKQVQQRLGELEEFERRAVTERTVSLYRSRLVEVIREADCRVRKLDVSSPSRRPWLENDDPLQQILPKGAAVKQTPFSLERRSVTMLVDGTMDNVQGLLKQLNDDKTLAYPSRLNLRSNGRHGGSVTLEMEMWLFALGRASSL